MVEKTARPETAGESLTNWRAAERALEVAIHAREAAEAAANAAQLAESSARKTAEAAKRALEAASDAEATARVTAEAAYSTRQATSDDLARKQSIERDAEGAEEMAKAAYHEAEERARQGLPDGE